jgi:hypothetical protein
MGLAATGSEHVASCSHRFEIHASRGYTTASRYRIGLKDLFVAIKGTRLPREL